MYILVSQSPKPLTELEITDTTLNGLSQTLDMAQSTDGEHFESPLQVAFCFQEAP